MNKINPLYNYDDAKEEQKTVRNILILQKQYGFDNIAVTEEKQAVKALIGKWPKLVQENFKAYVGGGSCDTLSQWIDHFLGWCSRARHAKLLRSLLFILYLLLVSQYSSNSMPRRRNLIKRFLAGTGPRIDHKRGP